MNSVAGIHITVTSRIARVHDVVSACTILSFEKLAVYLLTE
jgi:hypothetical protein